MDRRVKTAMWALGGLALAIALSMTAYAVAGGRLSEPAGNVRVIPSAAEEKHPPDPTKSPKPGHSEGPTDKPSSDSGAQPSPPDDHGGSSSPGTDSSGSGGSDDDADRDD